MPINTQNEKKRQNTNSAARKLFECKSKSEPITHNECLVRIILTWYGQQDLNRAHRRFDVLQKVELLRCVGDLLRKSVRFCEPQLPTPKSGRSLCSARLLVRATGFEPAHRKVLDPKSNASANSATPALIPPYFIINFQSCQPHFSLFLRPVRRFFAKSA